MALLNASLISADLKQYGTPLYELEAVLSTEPIFMNHADITVVDEATFIIDGYYVRIRQKAIDAGITTANVEHPFTIGQYRATRDFEYEGKQIAKGTARLLAE